MDEKRFRQHMEEARKLRPQTLLGKAARDLQKAVRAEAACYVGIVTFMRAGRYSSAESALGECTCITCGKVMPWNSKGCSGGHFLASRRASIVLEEVGIHPQCFRCNDPLNGNHEQYDQWMRFEHGQAVIDRLHYLKNNVTKQWTKEALVTLRIGYLDRIKRATQCLATGEPVAVCDPISEQIRLLELEFTCREHSHGTGWF